MVIDYIIFLNHVPNCPGELVVAGFHSLPLTLPSKSQDRVYF